MSLSRALTLKLDDRSFRRLLKASPKVARLAGRIPRRAYGEPSSPQLGLIGSGS